MKAPRLPIAIQQAVMSSLREKLAQANLKLGRNYPEPKLVYQQRGTAAGTAWLESYEIRLNPVLMMENQQAFIARAGASAGVEALWPRRAARQRVEVDDGGGARRSGPSHPSVRAGIGTPQYLPLPLPVPAAPAYRPPP